MPDLTLLEWAAKQEPWTQDALRRHAVAAPNRLSEVEKAEIISRVRHRSGFIADPVPACEPLAAAHLGEEQETKKTTVCSFGPVENLNRLAADQTLHFALNGLTAIFGGNGSGKSGYARVAKKLCRSLSQDDLLNNVFAKGAAVAAKVRVRYQVDGTAVAEESWTDGGVAPAALASISVFDSQNARLYVDKDNRIGFMPKQLALLEDHGSHCKAMDKTFSDELKEIEKRLKVALPGGYSVGGEVATLLAKLDPKKDDLPTAEKLNTLAQLSEEETAEQRRLEILLANDPAVLAARCRRSKAVLENYGTRVLALDAALSEDAATALKTAREDAKTAAEAAAMAAGARFANEPLKGVGEGPWRLMYDYAKAYIVTLEPERDKLPDQQGDPCVLCQQPLSAEAAARLQGFNGFVADEATKAADAAKALLRERLAVIQALEIVPLAQVERELAEYASTGADPAGLVSEIGQYVTAATARRDGLIAAVKSGDFSQVSALAASPAAKITTEASGLETEALAHEEAAKDQTRYADERAKLAALNDRKRLNDGLGTVLARLADLEHAIKLKACIKAVETAAISRQITALRRSLVMKNLEERILAEIDNLDLKHIPFVVTDRSAEGQSFFGVGLKTENEASNSKVLSEGEQRALALACFFAEAGTGDVKHGFIIDDPVSSLDHHRIRLVAARIVEECRKGRQVAVFTHNIFFYHELLDAAAKANPQVPVLQNFISKSETAGFGLISQVDEPWILQPVTKRIAALRERLKTMVGKDFASDNGRRIAKDFYTDLRETWERLIEEVLLGKVVERFNTDVKTQSLKGVVVEDEDYKTIFWAMKRVSQFSGHDMAAGVAIPVPKDTDMKAALDELDAFRTKADKRKKEVSKVREALEDPPKASVA